MNSFSSPPPVHSLTDTLQSWQSLLDHLPIPMRIEDTDGNTLCTNEAGKRLARVPPVAHADASAPAAERLHGGTTSIDGLQGAVRFSISVDGMSLVGVMPDTKSHALVLSDPAHDIAALKNLSLNIGALASRAESAEEFGAQVCRALVQPAQFGRVVLHRLHENRLHCVAAHAMPATQDGNAADMASSSVVAQWLDTLNAGAPQPCLQTNRGTSSADASWIHLALPVRSGDALWGVAELSTQNAVFANPLQLYRLAELIDETGFWLHQLSHSQSTRRMHLHDADTGLPGRSLFDERFTALAAEHGCGLLLLVGAGRLDEIAASYGPTATASVLRQITKRLEDNLEEQAMLAVLRHGVFAVFIPGNAPGNLSRFIIEHLAMALAEPYTLPSAEFGADIHMGACFFPEDGQSMTTLLAAAESALTNARKEHTPYRLYDRKMDASLHQPLQLESELRRAIERGELVNYYQPKVDLKTGKIVALEALMRWAHPDRGLLLPKHFISTLESSGLILQAGERAREQAVQDWRRLRDEGVMVPRIAVNITSEELRNADIVRRIERLLTKNRAEKGALSIEVTESSLMTDRETGKDILINLQQLGLPISIDDFGTGYSSLSYVVTLPIDELKIDRSFIMRMVNDRQYITLVKTIISLAHNLDFTVVAEGVETKEQEKLLQSLGCDVAQGYLYSRAVPWQELRQLLA